MHKEVLRQIAGGFPVAKHLRSQMKYQILMPAHQGCEGDFIPRADESEQFLVAESADFRGWD